MKKIKLSHEWILIILLALMKLIVHLLTNTNYELHRDAFLYITLGDYLDFGFSSVPPLIAVFANITRFLFGDSVFSIRLFPAFIGTLSVIVIGLIVRNLGGKKWAILLACSTFILSPAFLRSNTLFQPVSFNQFSWLLTTYFIIRMIKTKDPRFWIYLSIVWGVAFLNKYSIVFLVIAFLISLLFTPERKLFFSKYFLFSLLIGFLIILPNLIWQFTHNWPVVNHMTELQSSQLVHVNITDFLAMQLLMNLPGIVVWLFGFVFLMFFNSGNNFRIIAYMYIAVIIIFILFRGKPYYTLGIYPVLFAAGGIAIEKYLVGRLSFLRYAILTFMIILSISIIPYSLPILPLDKMMTYAEITKRFGISGGLRWEDGKIHSLPQDYADMIGWEELSQVVIKTFNNLNEDEKSHCIIYADNYGEAGAIKYYGKKYGLPAPVSFDASFLFWAPDSLNINTLIYINDEIEEISYFFKEVKQVGEITNPHARESGLPVYLCKNPRNNFERFYAEKVKKLKDTYR